MMQYLNLNKQQTNKFKTYNGANPLTEETKTQLGIQATEQ